MKCTSVGVKSMCVIFGVAIGIVTHVVESSSALNVVCSGGLSLSSSCDNVIGDDVNEGVVDDDDDAVLVLSLLMMMMMTTTIVVLWMSLLSRVGLQCQYCI